MITSYSHSIRFLPLELGIFACQEYSGAVWAKHTKHTHRKSDYFSQRLRLYRQGLLKVGSPDQQHQRELVGSADLGASPQSEGARNSEGGPGCLRPNKPFR